MREQCSISEKIAADGNLAVNEFCRWAGVSRVTAYREAQEGRLRILKIGRRSVVAVRDALMWRDGLPAAGRTTRRCRQAEQPR